MFGVWTVISKKKKETNLFPNVIAWLTLLCHTSESVPNESFSVKTVNRYPDARPCVWKLCTMESDGNFPWTGERESIAIPMQDSEGGNFLHWKWRGTAPSSCPGFLPQEMPNFYLPTI